MCAYKYNVFSTVTPLLAIKHSKRDGIHINAEGQGIVTSTINRKAKRLLVHAL